MKTNKHLPALSVLGIGENFKGVVCHIYSIIQIINPILFTLAFLFFFWGLSKFILSSGSKDEVVKGKNYMIWGILALFVLLTFQSIIGLVASDLELNTYDPKYSSLPSNISGTVCPSN